MSAHPFGRFYAVIKFVLPTMEDLKFSLIKSDSTCNYLDANVDRDLFPTQSILTFKNYSRKITSFIDFYQKVSSYYHTAHEILMKEISLILPNFPKDRKEKKSIIASLITNFIGFTYEGISSYLHNKRQKALHKAFVAMENKVNL